MTFSLMDNNGQGVWSANQEPITKENVNKIINAIKQYQGKWTSVSCGASIHFDNFTLTLFTLESAGLPTTDEGCIKLVNYWLSEYNKVIHYIKARTI